MAHSTSKRRCRSTSSNYSYKKRKTTDCSLLLFINEIHSSHKAWWTEYSDDFYCSLHREQSCIQLNLYDKCSVTEVTPKMLYVLMSWIVEIHSDMKYHDRVLYLTRTYMDLYFSKLKTAVSKKQLQLIATAALFIAAKFDEDTNFDAKETVEYCDCYSTAQLIDMEAELLHAIDYKLLVVTEIDFMSLYSTIIFHGHRQTFPEESLKKLDELSMYLLELSLLHANFIDFLPSVKAVAAIQVAARCMKLKLDFKLLEEHSQLSCSDRVLQRCVNEFHRMHCHIQFIIKSKNAVTEKYMDKSKLEVASIPAINCPHFL